MKNPIIDNRIVKDKTFALRMLSYFLESPCQGDPCSEDEKESMISYSTSLLAYQIETATDKDELDYLERCKGSELIKNGMRFLNINKL